MNVSRLLEPLYLEVFSELNADKPADLVIPLQVTRERILDSKGRVDRAEQPIYDAASAFVATMGDVAEERTKMLEAMLQASKAKAALDSRQSTSTSGTFFAQSVARRWEEEKRRRKPAADQLLARLRNAEREWNQRVKPDAEVDSFEVPQIGVINVTAEAPVGSANPLERDPYNKQRAIYPWRRTYYDRYGYPVGYPR